MVTWLNGLFSAGLVLAVIAQVLAYRSGDRTRQRQLVMVVGILAVVSLFAAGQIAGARLRDYANFIAARQAGGL